MLWNHSRLQRDIHFQTTSIGCTAIYTLASCFLFTAIINGGVVGQEYREGRYQKASA